MFNRLRDEIQYILRRDPAARTGWEVLTCYQGLHAIVIHRLTHFLWIHRVYWLAHFISYFARCVTGIEIHPAAIIGRRVFIDHGGGVVIGETAEVGDECVLYQGVTLGGTSLVRGKKRHPTLEQGVIVGAGAKVLGSFTVGAGAKIGSNSVVLKAVPAGATAVGNPAHVLIKSVGPDSDSSAPIFSSYGLTNSPNDPIAKALRLLIEQVACQEQQISSLQASLKQAGIECEISKDTGKFNPDQLNKLVE